MEAPGILVACESGSALVGDETYTFVRGVTRIRADHPLALSNPDYFEAVSEHVHYDVEQATRAPGEKRAGARKTKES